MQPDELRELTVKLIPRADLALTVLKLRHQLNSADIVNRALQVYEAIDGFIDDGGQLELFDSATRKSFIITIIEA